MILLDTHKKETMLLIHCNNELIAKLNIISLLIKSI